MPVALALLLLVGIVLVWLIGRSRQMFVLSVRRGQVLVVRGRVPAGLLADFRDIVARPPVAEATLKAIKEPDGAHLVASGIDAGTAQRLRNTFALYPVSKLRAAPPIRRPTMGQILGIAWLAWWLDRR